MADTTVLTLTHEPNALGNVNTYNTDAARHREFCGNVSRYFERLAGGNYLPGPTLVVQQNAGESAAAASATITAATVVAQDAVEINGVIFVAHANTDPGPNQFTLGANDTAAMANLAAQINASTDTRIAGVVTATAASGVVTVKSVDQSLTANAVQVRALGAIALANVTYSTASGAQTCSINGVSLTPVVGASDAATASSCASVINASANALVKGLVFANTGTAAHNAVCYVYAAMAGAMGNTITLAATGTGATASAARLAGATAGAGAGAAASGTVTIASGSGTITATINGIAISVTWASSDTATATALAAAIEASTNALVQGLIYATSSAGVVTVTSTMAGVQGNMITLAASGTGATASGARLTGGAAPTVTALGGGTSLPGTTASVQLKGGIGAEAAGQTFVF